ncbi:hypothetical protein R3P38DRAFT_2875115 [Favolaschia claudopus]|uniref:XPA C-terminal domain-containing protein n=1 Tax=Favolaschia claudopus TaxID=2862362 RepID=A0AAW0D6M2_9AGAR
MGWFDDNHPMGSAADDEMEAAMDAMGWNKWHKDPQPAGGSSEPARVERPESEWDESKWRRSNFREDDTMAKTKAKLAYLLTDKDLLPLQYQKQQNSRGFNGMKMYRKREVELLGWKKYGGPTGLKAAKEDKKNGIKSPKKGSKAQTSASAKANVLGGTMKGKAKVE